MTVVTVMFMREPYLYTAMEVGRPEVILQLVIIQQRAHPVLMSHDPVRGVMTLTWRCGHSDWTLTIFSCPLPFFTFRGHRDWSTSIFIIQLLIAEVLLEVWDLVDGMIILGVGGARLVFLLFGFDCFPHDWRSLVFFFIGVDKLLVARAQTECSLHQCGGEELTAGIVRLVLLIHCLGRMIFI